MQMSKNVNNEVSINSSIQVRVKCLSHEHNTMPAQAPNRTARSAAQRANHEAIAPAKPARLTVSNF